MASERRLGDGYEPHVDAIDGRLVYSLPVDSGFVSTAFAFQIAQDDLDVLLADRYRRAMLAVIAHTILQRSMSRGRPKVSQTDFDRLVQQVLHSAPDDLERFADAVGHEYNIVIRYYVAQHLTRQ